METFNTPTATTPTAYETYNYCFSRYGDNGSEAEPMQCESPQYRISTLKTNGNLQSCKYDFAFYDHCSNHRWKGHRNSNITSFWDYEIIQGSCGDMPKHWCEWTGSAVACYQKWSYFNGVDPTHEAREHGYLGVKWNFVSCTKYPDMHPVTGAPTYLCLTSSNVCHRITMDQASPYASEAPVHQPVVN